MDYSDMCKNEFRLVILNIDFNVKAPQRILRSEDKDYLSQICQFQGKVSLQYILQCVGCGGGVKYSPNGQKYFKGSAVTSLCKFRFET